MSWYSARFSRPISTASWHSCIVFSYSPCSKYTAATAVNNLQCLYRGRYPPLREFPQDGYQMQYRNIYNFLQERTDISSGNWQHHKLTRTNCQCSTLNFAVTVGNITGSVVAIGDVTRVDFNRVAVMFQSSIKILLLIGTISELLFS